MKENIKESFEKTRIAGSIAAGALDEVSNIIKPGITTDEIRELNLRPQEFLQTSSERRVKPQDPNRKVNFLGRLNRLFYQPEHQLPAIESLHDLIAHSR